MAHRYQTLLTPFVLPNGVVLRNRMVHPKCAPDQTQGPEDWPTEDTRFFYTDAARRGNSLVLIHVRNTPEVRKMPDTHDFAHSYTFDTNNPAVQNYVCQLVEDVHAYGSKILGSVRPMLPQGKSLGGIGPKFMQQSEGFFPMPPMQPATKEELKASIDAAIAEIKQLKFWNFDGIAISLEGLDKRQDGRTDEYGGSLENRLRYTSEFCDAVKKTFGKSFIIHAMIFGANPEEDRRPEDLDRGFTIDDLAEALKLLDGKVDLATIRESSPLESHPTGYTFQPKVHRCINMCKYLKEHGVKIPLAVSGGFQDPGEMEDVLKSGAADLVSIGRGLFTDPDFYEKTLEGRGEEIRPCVRCNRCHGRKSSPWQSVCTSNPAFCNEIHDKALIQPVKRLKKVAVIGGGPAGMQAAITCAERGHDVTLYEKAGELGGQMLHAKYFSFKWPFNELRLWMIAELGRKGVKVELNHEPTPEEITAGGYDTVIAAAGAKATLPNIEGMYHEDGTPALKTCHDVIGHEAEYPKNLIMVGCSETGVETACYLAENGHNITCLTRQNVLAKDASPLHSITIAFEKPNNPQTGEPYFAPYWERFENLKGITQATTTKVTDTTVTYVDADGAEHTLEADQVIVCGGVKPYLDGALKYAGTAPEFRMIGDVDGATNMVSALRSAYITGNQI